MTGRIINAIFIRMARPKKKQSDKKGQELRIAVTKAQKALVEKAVKMQKIDSAAAWMRTTLIDAASRIIDGEKGESK